MVSRSASMRAVRNLLLAEDDRNRVGPRVGAGLEDFVERAEWSFERRRQTVKPPAEGFRHLQFAGMDATVGVAVSAGVGFTRPGRHRKHIQHTTSLLSSQRDSKLWDWPASAPRQPRRPIPLSVKVSF